ncbi:MAG: adenylate/guanylate cyclase domain-containing protein [Bacteroidetes bacterium]|nr:adenylate/guanylate cyclase domain-containing protein [Bacteroidota bacterium]
MLRCSLTVPIFLLLFDSLPFATKLHARTLLPDTITSLWTSYKNAGDDSARVVYLSRLAFFYKDYLEDFAKSDSLAEAAIQVAEMSLQPELLIFAYNRYLESTDNSTYYKKSLGYAGKALQNSRITNNMALRWRTCRNLVQVYLSRYDFNNAISYSNECLVIANTLNNSSMIAESYLCIGSSNECKNQKIDAFRNYLVARDMAERIGDPVLLIKCYSRFAGFYNDNNLFDDAIECKRKEGELILSVKPIDTVSLMWTQFYLQMIDVRQKNGGLNEQSVRNVIDFAIRTRNERLKAGEFALYRKYLLETEELPVLYNFYKRIYPGEFEKLFLTDPEMYYRIKAYFKELEKEPDSANFFFLEAEHLLNITPDKNNIYKSNFYNRYGQFLVRQGRYMTAIEKFKKSYDLSKSDGYFGKFEYMLTASRHLEKLYEKAGDYKNAWFYASLNLQIFDSISAITKNDQIMAEAVKRERSLKELAAEQDRQKIRQGMNVRNMMAGGVVFFIIVSLLVFRNYRNQKRLNKLLDEAKNQSDLLLLNILPHETAEELKTTGKAVAKRFEEVTVMFTDFKNFTQASERMSAEELVDEINFYYSEFDTIVSRHNIEKIKIIGDSYMCAGGLPVANNTHAFDVVEAAMELQDFMSTLKAERTGREKSFFELRIGIHTGPVVAGIVGHKKFAYDIWGDTVNTASRMESAGEPGKINISGETWEKVKDRFKCTYRGKVAAKHKGEIDMYFVETGTT